VNYLSVCSGVEAVSVAWRDLPFKPVAFSEIEPFPCAVLAHHYPAVPNYGDMTKFKEWPDATVDLLVGGTPCQAFSVAGLRKGLADPRGNLTLTFLAIANRYRPEWILWENVPGVLSIDGGRTFGTFLRGLAELGYGFAYRILDAQYFGVAQRRRRVFVVANARDWRRAAAVLFERESLRGDSPPSREEGKSPARSLRGRANSSHREDSDNFVAEISPALSARDYKSARPEASGATLVAHSLRADGFDASEDGTGRGTPIVPVVAPCLTGNYGKQPDSSDTSAGPMLVPIDMRQTSRGEKLTNNRAHGSGGAPGHGVGEAGDPAFTVSERGQAVAFDWQSGGDSRGLDPKDTAQLQTCQVPAVAFQEAQTGCREYPEAGTLRANGPGHDPVGTRIRQGMQVRRLTPTECERLQGFPDGYTAVPYRGKPASDGPRYKALGNSMAVPVMRWLGRRVVEIASLEPLAPPES
jgi:DNA (cytosine-5)-methyltransferase 1